MNDLIALYIARCIRQRKPFTVLDIQAWLSEQNCKIDYNELKKTVSSFFFRIKNVYDKSIIAIKVLEEELYHPWEFDISQYSFCFDPEIIKNIDRENIYIMNDNEIRNIIANLGFHLQYLKPDNQNAKNMKKPEESGNENMKIKAKKVFSHDAGDFTTLEHTVMMCSNFSGNNNKFYCIELQKSKTSENFRIFTHYGRLGLTDNYDIREKTETDNPLNESIARHEYEYLIKKKCKGKNMDSYQEKYEIVHTMAPTVGSSNIRNRSVHEINISTSSEKNETNRIINQITEENIHNITTTLDVKISGNGFETALGPVTKEHLARARKCLDRIQLSIETNNNIQTKIMEENSEFFSLIPHKFGYRIDPEKMISTIAALDEKYNLLDMLETSVEMGTSLFSSAEKRMAAIGIEITELSDRIEWERIEEKIQKTKADNHRNINVWNIKPKNIFEIRIPHERNSFRTEGYPIGNIAELFHGSRNCNILSIMKNGLKIFRNHPTKAGEMFGPGLYFADSSTKSANYSTGFWGSVKNKYNNNFMFIADVALGNIHEITSSRHYTDPPHGFNSVKGCRGTYLYNNEFIVYRENQATLKYLVEFTC
jgi:poly [ADP-ribose] polymerase